MAEGEKPTWQTPTWVKEHVEKYLSDPEAAEAWDSSLGGSQGMLPTLLLTTKGRRSGEPRHSPLIYQPAGDGFVVIASKGGWPTHPAWYLNLQADPEAEVRAGKRHLRVEARTAKGEERAALWKKMRDAYPPYDNYQTWAKDREIPVVVLEPI